MRPHKTFLYAAPLFLVAPLAGVLFAPVGRRADSAPPGPSQTERPYGIQERVAWTTSRVTGSPEPPPPYRIERVFPGLSFSKPLLITGAPGTSRLFVGEHAGKLYSFPNDPACKKADLFLDLTTELRSWDRAGKVKGVGAVYGLTFHPRFASNRYCYVCYVLDSKKPGEQLPDGTRVSRFLVTDTDPPRCDPKSEKVLITWLAGGHNGGDLKFGPEGYLYISTGDAADPNPPDRLDTGQDISDLLSSVLRIDVDREGQGKPYTVPADNPFLKTPGARPEVWAYGFRNPWRMSFDRKTGDLWVGDVGWELWEMVYRVLRGGNYGWSVMEGRQPVRPGAKRGPTPILPPALDFPHTEAASITGGYVYRGKRLKDLVGAYICGDWVTGRLWGTRFDDGDRITSHRELARSPLHIVAFGEDHEGELYFLNYEEVGAVYRLVPNEAARGRHAEFPRRLSETGLFASVKAHEPAPGVVPFSIRAEQWADHATAERLLALPGRTSVRAYDRPVPIPGGFFHGQVFFPRDGVLARTISLEMERGNPRSRRRLETQVLHFDGDTWNGYSYRWNDEQTDAALVPAAGADHTLTVKDAAAPGGVHKQTWHFPARAECLQCHNPWSGYALAFNPAQLDRDHDYGAVADNQLRTYEHVGIVTPVQSPGGRGAGGKPAARLVDPYDPAAGLDERARSYLHVNCSQCHQFGAGGTADIDFRYDLPLGQTKALEARPVQGSFEIRDAQILAPGDPYRSVLFYRMAKLGRGRMPHIGSEVVDERGLRLVRDWIRQLPVRKDERALLDKLRALDEAAALARERAEAPRQIRRAAQALAQAAGREAATDLDRQKAEARYRAEAAGRARRRAAERADVINQLLSSTTSALLLLEALDDGRLPDPVRAQAVELAMARPEGQVRDLFERFVPDDRRVRRLGSVINPEQILALKGDAARGRELFFKAAGLQCVNCHKVAGTGSTLGPDLSAIGKKSNRAQILESLLEPSKVIDPPYVAYLVETTDGTAHTGLLAAKTEREVVLKDATGKEVRIPARKVTSLVPQKKSLMPDLLLRDLTAEQAADLLEFLVSLKGTEPGR
jgi:putative heme-binding domain-containing protein